ncbi:MAG: hypothetical protein R3E66_05910 [bacterium]
MWSSSTLNAALDVRIDDLEEIHDKFLTSLSPTASILAAAWVALGARIVTMASFRSLFADFTRKFRHAD